MKSLPVMHWLLNPYVQIFAGALTVTASELLLKSGANATSHSTGIFGIGALASGYTWLGILCYIVSFLSWIYVLKHVPLVIAYALINIAHVTVPVGSSIFLHEQISPGRWLGIALVFAGLLLVMKQVAHVEEKLDVAA